MSTPTLLRSRFWRKSKGFFQTSLELPRVSDQQKKSISLHTADSPYVKDARFLIIPADLHQDFTPCSGSVDRLDGYSAWLKPNMPSIPFPPDEELLLIEFRDQYVFTHRTRVTERQDGCILVAAPSLTEQEESQLAPTTGRHDYRVKVDVPIQIRYLNEKPGTPLKTGQLLDLSRGGMSFHSRDTEDYEEGAELNLQVVSWEYPVNIDAEISRVKSTDDGLIVAVKFKNAMSVRQREMVSAFILQVQRRDALSRSLPSENV